MIHVAKEFLGVYHLIDEEGRSYCGIPLLASDKTVVVSNPMSGQEDKRCKHCLESAFEEAARGAA